MLPEPGTGFVASLEKSVRTPTGKIKIVSHSFITSTMQNGSVVVDSSNTYAQSFSLSSTTSVQTVDLFIGRNDGVSSDVDIRILADNGGIPDTGTVIAEAALFGIHTKRPQFYSVSFDSSPTLTGATTYWLEMSVPSGDLEIRWYLNDDVTGFDYALNTSTVTSDKALIFKLVSTDEDDNFYELPNLLDYSMNITSKFENDSGSATFSNIGGLYDEIQPLKHFLVKEALVKIYIGNSVDDLLKSTMIINSVDTRDTTLDLSFLGLNSKLISQNVQFKTSYIGIDFGRVVLDLVIQAGLINTELIFADTGLFSDAGLFSDPALGGIDLTGVLFPSGGTLDGKIIDAIRKIEQATGYAFRITNEGIPEFKERDDDLTVDYIFEESKHILQQDLSLNESKKNMFNRIIINNMKTNDGEKINADAATTINNFTGTIAASTREVELSYVYSTSPVVGAILRNKDTLGHTEIHEIGRSVDSITFTVRNLNYPNDTADYDVDLIGSTLTNNDASLLIIENAKSFSMETQGIIDFQIDNDLFTNALDMSKLADRLLLLNSFPRDFHNLNTISVPVLELDDVVKVDHDKIKNDFIFKITTEATQFSNSPRKLTTTYGVERFPVLEGGTLSDTYLYADDGNDADDSLIADSEITADYESWI